MVSPRFSEGNHFLPGRTRGSAAAMNRDFVIAATLLLSLLVSPVARAQQTCVPIHFAQGQSSATVQGIARNEEPFACYTLATRRGQTATLSIAKRSPKDDTAFTIPGVVDNRDQYTFKTEDKAYKIMVYLTFARQPPRPFLMQVTVSGEAGKAASGDGAAHFECPASLDGHKALNWNLFDGSHPVPQQLAEDGSGTVVWTITPAQAAGGNVRIVCGYRDTRQVNAFQLSSGIRRCSNRQMSRAFDCQ
jgi:hypothetical protein